MTDCIGLVPGEIGTDCENNFFTELRVVISKGEIFTLRWSLGFTESAVLLTGKHQEARRGRLHFC